MRDKRKIPLSFTRKKKTSLGVLGHCFSAKKTKTAFRVTLLCCASFWRLRQTFLRDTHSSWYSAAPAVHLVPGKGVTVEMHGLCWRTSAWETHQMENKSKRTNHTVPVTSEEKKVTQLVKKNPAISLLASFCHWYCFGSLKNLNLLEFCSS